MIRLMVSVAVLACLLLLGSTAPANASDEVSITTGVDVVSRYVWRGLDIASTPSVQPTLALDVSGFELGIWGAYTLSNQASGSDEIDFWASYTLDLESGVSITGILTDYYFPNAGIDFFNFNNYDAVDDEDNPDPGAHTIEIGGSITGPETFPATLSAFINVHNDAGNNVYLQGDYPVVVSGTDLNFFCGATLGSEDNPGYYGSDEFAVINVGVSATRELNPGGNVSLPLTLTFILNPDAEISHLVAGLSF